ncbi:T9SS type A sorting domain-containing protein [Dyadobacter sp. OTU695]|uniref:T9SS type A sorting domain-containing protein n=1 Tax=Dyadobacter sp. OTU695 TaxID=3043860 RepID=UPI00313B9A1B
MKKKLRSGLAILALTVLGLAGARAQSPGGVAANLKIWLRPEAFSPSSWTDASGSGNNFTQTNTGRQPFLVPAVGAEKYNFNPFVDFGTTGSDARFMVVPTGRPYSANGSNSTLFTTSVNRNVSGYSDIIGFGATTTGAGLINANSPVYTNLASNIILYPYTTNAGLPQVQVGKTYLNDVSFTVGTAGIKYGQNGQTGTVNNTFAAGNAAHANGAVLGSQPEVRNGLIGEVIAYERDLTEDEKIRVRSYLAIKYGLTLPHNYVASNGTTTFWDQAANTGYNNNLAGIAHDAGTMQNQKQSMSVNDGKQVLISTTGLADGNATNTVALTDGQFLTWGDNGLAKAPVVAFTGAGINFRFAAIWKAQNSGSVGAVRVAWPAGLTNLKLIQSSDQTIDSSDPVTDMSANTQVINGLSYNYADVSIADGQYFSFAAYVQSPGGVATAAWYKADAQGTIFSDGGTTVATDAQQVQQWNEYQGKGFNLLQATTASRPVFSTTTLANFNPTVTFDGSNDQMFYTAPDGVDVIDRANGSLYAAGKIKDVQNSGFLGFHVSMNYPGLHMFNFGADRKLLFFTGGPGYQGFSGDPITANSFFTAGAGWQNGAGANAAYLGGTTSFDGVRTSYSGSEMQNAIINNASRDLYIGWDSDCGPFSGQLNELMVFDNRLSEDEMDRVESYLAIKYGTTYAKGSRDYKNSSSGVVWGQATNNGFHFNIAGIAKDLGGSLDQRQSWSTNSGQQVLIGSNAELSSTNESHSSTLADGQFLLWGDNGLAKAPGDYNAGLGHGVNALFKAIWKVQNTGGVGTVRVAWPAGLNSLSLVQSADATIDGSDIFTPMASNTQAINGVTYNYADVTLSDGQYFTFAGYLTGPGGVGVDLSLWYKADNGVEVDANKKVTGWNNSAASDVKLTMSSPAAYIPYNDQTTYAKTWNFNPTLSFDGTNNYLRNNTTSYLNTGGSVHYITVARLSASTSSANSIFAISGNDDGFFLYPQGGLIYPLPAIGNGYNAAAAGPGTENRFGIYSAILPKTGSPANQRGFYNGLQKVYTSPYPITGGSYTLPTMGAYVGADGTTADNANGDIAEVILYHEPTGGDMANEDLARIHSYLAIKYGITLDQTTAQNYINSASSVVWDASTNTGYQHNIAGIGRDNEASLYQKQSWSVNAGQQVLIGTTGLASTNQANAIGLDNGQFLIWGDNGQTKAPGSYNGGLGHGVNVLFKAIWKVQNTSSIGTVRVAWPAGLNNLSLVQSADATIDGSDTFTPMASNTQTINGVAYNYADVTLSDGQYFTFATLIQNAPGGVFSGLSQWYRADMSITNTGDATDVTAWTDVASGIVASEVTGVALPKFKTGAADYFNFNPGVNFTAADQTIGNLGIQTLSAQQYDVFTLTKDGISAGFNGRIFSSLVNNANQTGNIAYWDGLGINAANSVERVNTTYSYRYLANPGNISWSTNSPSIMYHTFTNTTVAKGLNGAAKGATATHPAIGDLNGGFTIGTTQFPGNGSDNAGFTGHIGELVVYGSGNITPLERNKVDSYLAIKYGVTLADTVNYITSAGDTVWNSAANTGFYRNVAGLGRDNISVLHQKQSRSQHVNTNGQLTIGLGQIAATNPANPGTIADGQFLMWGDNGQIQAMTNSAASYATFTYAGGATNGRRMTRVWKAQNTDMGQEVLIRFPQASVGNTTFPGESCSQFVLLVANDAEFATGRQLRALTLNGTDYEAQYSFPAGVKYFTFAKVNGWASGIVNLPAAVTAAPDFSTCATDGWNYAKQTTSTDKYLAINGLTGAQLGNLDVTIDPVGTEFNGTIHTKLMPRVATITDATNGTYTGVKVRVYFSQSELDATIVSGAVTNGWFKFEGDADAARSDINADGLLNPAKAIALTPSASGVEDGISYVEFDDVTSFSSFVYVSTTNETALPVRLVRFEAARKGSSAQLTWETADESDNKGFEIQRGAAGSDWQTIGFVGSQTADGNSSSLLRYSFTDETPMTGKNYYRLKQVDWDGSSAYSRIEVIDFSASGKGLVLYPNPVAGGVITLDLPEGGMLEVNIYNLSGSQVKAFKQISRALDVKGLSSGKYILKTVSENGQVYEKTFIIP